MPVFPIKGAIQNYAWGGSTFIPNLVDIENPDQKPFAELWMGAHHRGPAKVYDYNGGLTLTEYIARDPKNILGKAVASAFDNHLPFLFKVLDVNKMLSIQTHPTKAQAVAGFKRENEAGIPLDAFHRNFKDDNHKPEVMVALTDFWLLHGFKSAEAITDTFQAVEELNVLLPQFKDQNIRKLYQYIMELPQDQVDELLYPLHERLMWGIFFDKSDPDYWAKMAFEDYTRDGHFDRGIFSIYMYNIVHLEEGEGIYQSAGIPHAYLEGVNVELMANSDNVFRGGLTPKHVDVPELLKHIITDPVTPAILKGTAISALEKVYQTPAPDFEVSAITLLEDQIYLRESQAPDIIIVMKGAVNVEEEGTFFKRERGDVFFATADSQYSIIATTDALLYRASIPLDI